MGQSFGNGQSGGNAQPIQLHGQPPVQAPAQTNGSGSGSGSVLPDQSQTFMPYKMYMPSEFNSNTPINNPQAILDAYMNNAPAFLKAAEGNPTMPPATALKNTHEGK